MIPFTQLIRNTTHTYTIVTHQNIETKTLESLEQIYGAL